MECISHREIVSQHKPSIPRPIAPADEHLPCPPGSSTGLCSKSLSTPECWALGHMKLGGSGLLAFRSNPPVNAPRRKTAVRVCHAQLSELYSRDSSHALCHRCAVWAGVLATVDHDSSLQVMRVWLNGSGLLQGPFPMHCVALASPSAQRVASLLQTMTTAYW